MKKYLILWLIITGQGTQVALASRLGAVLFTLGKFVSLEEIGTYCEISSVGIVKEALEELKRDYQNNGNSLEIQEHEGKFKLNIKKEFGPLANRLLSSKEMDSPTTKTLAIIAYKQPIKQSVVINIRGNKAYDHIKKFSDAGLVKGKRAGHTKELSLSSL